MMQVQVLLFGAEAAAAGRDRVAVELAANQPTCAHLRRALADAQPCLQARLDSCRFAVNHRFARDDQRLEAGDEIALIGMVSGG